MPRHTIPWTDEEVATLTALDKAGKTPAEIGRKLRRSERAVESKLARMPGWVTRRNLARAAG